MNNYVLGVYNGTRWFFKTMILSENFRLSYYCKHASVRCDGLESA
jgi:hypothetical protein